MPTHLRDALAQAKMKEWTGWCHYDTVEILKTSEVQTLPRYVQAVPTRFVITDKNETLRTPENPLPVLGSLLAQHMALA